MKIYLAAVGVDEMDYIQKNKNRVLLSYYAVTLKSGELSNRWGEIFNGKVFKTIIKDKEKNNEN